MLVLVQISGVDRYSPSQLSRGRHRGGGIDIIIIIIPLLSN